MAYKCREEIVGKRFLSVSAFTKLKSGKISEWGWRAGVVRAASHKDNTHPDLQVLVEYDGIEWHRREWIHIYKDQLFHLFLVEQRLVWVERRDPFAPSNNSSLALWPALTFSPLVSCAELTQQQQPVEFLLDRELAFKDYKNLKPFQEWDATLSGVREYPELRAAVRRWAEQQDGQRILLTTPSVLVGYRVEVYRAEGTTQWYTAVIVGYNDATRDLTVTDDTVLEEHNEDPALVQMRLIGDGVVESIMRGENVGITPRRSRSAVLQTQHQQQPSRSIRGLSSSSTSVTSGSSSTTTGLRKHRSINKTHSDSTISGGISPEPPDKGSLTKTRRRKTSESETVSTKLRHHHHHHNNHHHHHHHHHFTNIKEDLENKQQQQQGRKKNLCNRNSNSSNKKKVLEEANNSKLRQVEVRVEDCLGEPVVIPPTVVSPIVCSRSSFEANREDLNNLIEQSSVTTNVRELEQDSIGHPLSHIEDDSVLDDTSNSSSVQLVPVEVHSVVVDDDQTVCRSDSMPVSETVTGDIVSEEDDCVIVAQRTQTPKIEERECSSRGDDDGPLSSSSPFSRMELSDSTNASLRFADDRSDSGVSSLRSSSGDERSGSRSSALSSTDEPQQHNNNNNNIQNQPTNRSPLFIPASNHTFNTPTSSSSSSSASETVRVWRDPNLLLESEPHVRHIHSVQHQSLLMSHPSTPAASGPPPTSAASHPASLYPPVPPPPTLMGPHPLQHHPHLAPPPGLYPHPHHLSDMLWKQRYTLPVSAAHLLSQPGAHPAAEEMLERERAALLQDRDRHERSIRERQNQEVRELEKHKEKERLERERQEREREREKQEREREEKERQQQALQNHFEKSLRQAAQQKRDQWNLIGGRPPQSRTNNSEEERKRLEQEMHQREQRHLTVRSERDHRPHYATCQRSPNVSSKADYPPPPAHSRIPPPTSKPSDKLTTMHSSIPKSDLNMFGYPVCQPFFPHEPKTKTDHHKSSQQSSGLVVTKSGGGGGSSSLERDVLPNPPPLMSEMKNSVIVKHDGSKSSHHLEPRVSIAHSPSPKLRNDMISGHYLSAPNQPKSNLYEYRSPTQSPHHLSHTSSPHYHLEPQNLGKTTHHRQSNQLPSPHHQQQSPHHPHAQQHPSPELRYRSNSESQAMIYPTSTKTNYPFLPNTTSPYSMAATTVANSKPKVSSPAPHHIYGKPSAGIVAGVPLNRAPEPLQSTPIKMGSKLPLSSSVSPSPYQQVSQYHPPHPQIPPSVTTCPPPAHSRTTASDQPRYDRMYAVGSAPPSVKVSVQHGTSPPTAASAPLAIQRSHPQYMPAVTLPTQNLPSVHSIQTQPLDLGVSSNKYGDTSNVSPKRKGTPVSSVANPVCLEVKKRRIEAPTVPIVSQQQHQQQQQSSMPIYVGQPQLARVSEPSPLIASAATTITTVVNTAAYRTPSTSLVPTNNSNSSLLITDNLPDVSVTAVNVDNNNIGTGRPASTDSNHQQQQHSSVLTLCNSVGNSSNSSSSSSSSPAPPSSSIITTTTTTTVTINSSSAPTTAISTTTSTTATTASSLTSQSETDSTSTTPVKTIIAPSSVDSEKSNSPGPNKTSNSYPVRHLKKAWLQRHTGEDMEDNTGVTGSGSCVTLPINISVTSNNNNNNNNNNSNPNNKENPVHTLHSVGSMAVNSINKTKHFSNKTNNRKTPNKESTLNGHPNDTATTTTPTTKNVSNSATSSASANSGSGAAAADDSSSSDQDRGRKSPPKRKPPKVKRKKGNSTSKKTSDEKKRKTSGPSVLPVSESGSDSEKESGSEKDSDSGASSTTTLASTNNKKTNPSSTNNNNNNNNNNSNNNNNKEPRKRGRRPKSSKNDKGEEPRPKKSKDETVPQRDPFRKPPVGQLKKTGESFLQDGPCFEVAPKLAKCRECRWTPNQRSKNILNIFCRFYAFRRLRYTKNGQLAIAGFSDPHKDALEEDLKLWLPNPDTPPTDLDLETSRFILKQVGDHFCDLLVQEKEAHAEYVSDDKTIAWKRVVQGVREMCDVCETTLFNFHWACGKCGFVVCLDCYKSRKNGSIKIWGEPGKDRDEFSWLLCTNRQAHEQEKLMLTQIIAGDSLTQLGKMVHEMRELWNIEQYCGCPTSKEINQKSNNGVYKEIIKKILSETKINGIKEIKEENDTKPPNGVKDEKTSPLSWLADVALSNEDKKGDDNNSSDSDEGSFSTLRELLIRPSHKPNGSRAGSPVSNQKNNKKPKIDTLDEVISSVIEDSVQKTIEQTTTNDTKAELKHFLRRYNWQAKGRAPLPIRIMTLTESKMLYPDVPHSWLCDGKLLRLTDSMNKDNYKIFQDQWKRGQPVIVSDVTRNLTKDLWNPESFARDFGDEKNDLINCMNGNLVPNQPMRKFWEGFDHFSKRLKDERGNPMLLKLKDWPPGEDFAEMLPSRYNDLMKVLPLSEYTHRTGRLNLASRLPDCFVRPDLGPKMYNAYGSALHPSKGTTNLHLDISDAVNVMVYVGIPKDGDSDEHIKEAFRAIDEAGCDILTRRRVRDKGELPGALWHIYNARDADKIRDLLNKVVVEKGGRLEPHHDPIHDQSCYLDGPLRERLYKEYGVEGYAIVQCLGDAVFIPAGAPHQVRNLHNCIKIAEDFVSPENVSHCFHLTQEFRDLSDTHSNHEDKLQIKNIIYHAVKDALSSISAVLNKHIVKSEKHILEQQRNGGGNSNNNNNNNNNNSNNGVNTSGPDGQTQNSTTDSTETA